MPTHWATGPRSSVEAECARRSRSAVVAGCIDLLAGREVDDGLILALAGPAAEPVLAGREGGRGGHWPRVWGARGLLYAWEERAAPAVVAATRDPSWRVREMAAKVVARHRIGDALDSVAALRGDPVPRVGAAARRALAALTEAGA